MALEGKSDIMAEIWWRLWEYLGREGGSAYNGLVKRPRNRGVGGLGSSETISVELAMIN